MNSKKTFFFLVMMGIILVYSYNTVTLMASSTEILRPNGQGSMTQMGEPANKPYNWQQVDDVVPDDGGYYGGGTYVHKYGSGYLWDLYALSEFTGSGTINKITVYFRCDYEWGVDGWATPIIRTGGNNYYGSEVTLQDEWTTFSYTWNNNPYTGTAWTAADLNQLEAGIGLYGGSDDEARCTQIYVVVDYVPWNNFTEILRPNGQGSMTQMGEPANKPYNWQQVDDVVPDDGGYYGGGTYVHKYGSGYLWDLYALSDFTGSGTINKITVYFRCDYEWGVGGWATPIIRTGGNNYYGSEVTLQDAWTTFSYTWTNNPRTGTAWTSADLNQLEAGIGLYGGNDDEARCTQVYVLADYLSNLPLIHINWPNGGDKVCRRGTYDINWVTYNISGNVDISLIKDTGEIFTIAQNVSNTGHYSWTIAQDIPAATDYKIKISANSGTVYDLSDSLFSIFEILHPINLFALPKVSGKVYLGWRLSDQKSDIGYNIYRSLSSGSGYTKINAQPVTNSTNYVDSTVSNGTTYYYFIRAVDTNANGFESGDSQIVNVTASTQGTNRYRSYSNFVPNPNSDTYGDIKVGDVDNDGFCEFLVAAANNTETISGLFAPIRVMLFDHDGTILWGPIDTYVSWRGELPWTLCDLNGDNKDEIIGLKFDNNNGNALNVLRLVVMDNTGTILSQSDNVPHQYDPYTGNRMNITIAYLNGSTPSTIVNCGIYTNSTNEIMAYNPDCSLLWRYTYAANDPWGGGGQMIRAADLNLDGNDEVLHGTTVFTGTGQNGTPQILWQKGWGHVDFVEPKNIRSDKAGLEVLLGCEQAGGDLELLDKDGNQLWYHYISGYHAQLGWAANMTNDCSGLECYVIFDDDSSGNWPYYLHDSSGNIIESGYRTRPEFSQPIDWDGDNVMEKHDQVITNLLNPAISMISGIPILQNMYVFIADIIGDYREELIILIGGTGDHVLTGQFYIYTNTTLNSQRKQSPWTDRLYSESKKRTGYRD